MNEFIKVKVSPNARLDNRTIVISQELARPAGIEDNQEISFFVGQHQRKLQVKVSSSDKLKNSISMNPAVMRRSFLRSGRKYGIRVDRDEIHLGPVVGIMAEAFPNSSKPFGSQSFFFKQLLSAGRRLGEICFVFSPYSINWNRKNVYGYMYTSGAWKKAVFPLPDVIYPRERGYSPAMRRIRRKLTNQGIQFINPLLIGKWETHKIISQNEMLVPYLPDTRLIRNFDQVNRMIKRYRAVYLKPVTGSQGRNIIKVVKRKNSSRYQYQYQINNQSYRGTASSLTGLRSSLRRVMGNRRYIAQKQINLLKTEGHIIDIRILVQKDHTGQWSTTGMACRVGKRGSITSNISAGGSGRKVPTVLRRKFTDEEQVQSIINNIQFVAVEAAKTIENAIGSSGEMGVDVGIDKVGKAWFIEANLRPARQVFILIGEKKTRQKSVEKPMSYCRYLAGFR
ncbi:MAG: YheC/YheD family protein [Syntrophomonadaceae bacterium]|nr:YheC/YheD family protein [Syntrophomonadaceae bacterium]MDD3889814.1 YheC/YheD family protein [Syntrophomonadaceae bacterium]MDD4549828.1 YheC/YheD family protein [Syntrophomonadaceae bacterium]